MWRMKVPLRGSSGFHVAARVLGWLGVLTLLMGSGCHRPAGGLESQAFHGVFVLQTVDGLDLPAKVVHGKDQVEVRSGSMTFNEDGTCVSRTVFVPPSGVEANREVVADYTRHGSKVRMTWSGAGKTVGTIEGKAFTMNNEGMVFAYQQ